jgi:hypothetical protein
LTLYTIALTLSGCGGGGGSTSTDPINITITDNYQVESLGSADIINATVSVENTAKSLYLVLSNSDTVSATSTITHNAKVTTIAQSKMLSSTEVQEKPRILHHPQYVEDFNSQMGTLLSKAEENKFQAKTITLPERMEDSVGDPYSFCTDIDMNNGTCVSQTSAKARKVITDVPTKYGPKTLNIWVSDDSYGIGCPEDKCITETMLDALADTFLKRDSDNDDIYDWVTNIYGEEWGAEAEAKYSNLIPANDEITILLTDIDNDGLPSNGEGRVVGFFWSKDNFKVSSIAGSNERIMFYIDSVMFANEEGLTWEIDDFWPKEMISTLAHEFQHMIHFYQKTTLLANDNTNTWVNEMLSESTEDLVATKIRHIGPRGVDYLDGSAGDPDNILGRYPLFNENNTLSLTAWNGVLADYSKVNAFGAYLLRNYGGAKLFHDIMHNTYIDEQAVVDAVNKTPEGSGKTFGNLLAEWGVAVMLSDHENLMNTPEYNTGWFTESVYGSITYELGSINFFNYIPQPTIYTTSGTIQPQGNYYYKIGDNLTGDISISLELNGQTEATLIAK